MRKSNWSNFRKNQDEHYKTYLSCHHLAYTWYLSTRSFTNFPKLTKPSKQKINGPTPPISPETNLQKQLDCLNCLSSPSRFLQHLGVVSWQDILRSGGWELHVFPIGGLPWGRNGIRFTDPWNGWYLWLIFMVKFMDSMGFRCVLRKQTGWRNDSLTFNLFRVS